MNPPNDAADEQPESMLLYKWKPKLAANLTAGVAVVGVSCGVLAYLYSTVLDAFLTLTWRVVPNTLVHPLVTSFTSLESHAWVSGLYVVGVATLYGAAVGGTQLLLGAPGDMPETVGSFNSRGYVSYDKAISMFFCSLLSVTAGGSLGPEAPLLSLCASLVTFIYKRMLGAKMPHLRYFSLMGMAAGLAAFFGVGVGGALFAMEVPHRMGLEHYEAGPYALASALLCLAVFRALAAASFGQIWPFQDTLLEVDVRHIVLGAVLGAAAAATATAWAAATRAAKRGLRWMGLDEHATPVMCGTLGGFAIGLLGAVLPPVLFWGEFELRSLADVRIPLAHIWPSSGFWAARMEGSAQTFLAQHDDAAMFALIGVAKLAAITISLATGFRGGFIFPLMFSGAALGTAMHHMLAAVLSHRALRDFPPILFAMSFASGLNTAVTRTPLATPLILATLSGQGTVVAPASAAALTALFLTRGMRVIATQQSRSHAMPVPWLDGVRGEPQAEDATTLNSPSSPLASMSSLHAPLV